MILAGVAIVSVIAYAAMYFQQDALQKKDAALKEIMKTYSVVDQTKADKQQRDIRVNQMNAVMDAERGGFPKNTKVFKTISDATPDDIFMMNYSLNSTGDISITGKSKNSDSVAYFLYKLKGTGLFSDISIININSRLSDTGVPLDYSFTISAKLIV